LHFHQTLIDLCPCWRLISLPSYDVRIHLLDFLQYFFVVILPIYCISHFWFVLITLLKLIHITVQLPLIMYSYTRHNLKWQIVDDIIYYLRKFIWCWEPNMFVIFKCEFVLPTEFFLSYVLSESFCQVTVGNLNILKFNYFRIFYLKCLWCEFSVIIHFSFEFQEIWKICKGYLSYFINNIFIAQIDFRFSLHLTHVLDCGLLFLNPTFANYFIDVFLLGYNSLVFCSYIVSVPFPDFVELKFWSIWWHTPDWADRQIFLYWFLPVNLFYLGFFLWTFCLLINFFVTFVLLQSFDQA